MDFAEGSTALSFSSKPFARTFCPYMYPSWQTHLPQYQSVKAILALVAWASRSDSAGGLRSQHACTWHFVSSPTPCLLATSSVDRAPSSQRMADTTSFTSLQK